MQKNWQLQWKIGFSNSNFQGLSKMSESWEEGKAFRKTGEECLGWEWNLLPSWGCPAYPISPQVFEVCYLDSELSHARQEEEGGGAVWQRGRGLSVNLRWLPAPLMPGISLFRPAGKWRKDPSQDFAEKYRCLFRRIDKAAFLCALFLCLHVRAYVLGLRCAGVCLL